MGGDGLVDYCKKPINCGYLRFSIRRKFSVSRAPMNIPGGQWSSGLATSHNIYYQTKSQGVKMKLAIETEGKLSRSLGIFRTLDLDTGSAPPAT